MKTSAHILSRIFGTMFLSSAILLLYPAQAGNDGFMKPDTALVSLASTNSHPGSDVSACPIPGISNEMLNDPLYWVNYLKNTVNPDQDDASQAIMTDNEMLTNPDYWIDYLRQTVKED